MPPALLGFALAAALHAAAAVGAPESAAPLARGVVIERVACAETPGQSYALYLPSSYSPERRWPILYAFDPAAQGARPVRLAAEAAERLGFIVAGSNNSRNGPMAEIQAAVQAMLRDTGARFPLDDARIYAAGFSGGARVATGLALGCRGCVAGVFAQGGGLPSGTRGKPAMDFAWFAAAGERDMNFPELFELEQELEKRGARQRLRSFDGGHEWGPSAVWSEALDWFELLAVKDGRRARDGSLATRLLEQAEARAAAFRQGGEPLEERRELASIVRDFEGLADTRAARLRLQELEREPGWRAGLKRERRMIDEQARLVAGLQAQLLALEREAGATEALALAAREANALVRGLARAKERDDRIVYERALAQAFIGAMEAGRGALREKKAIPALSLFDVAATLRPQAPAPQAARAQAQALAGRRGDAVKSLRRAVELGLPPAELRRLLELEAFAGLRGDPELGALLERAAPPS